MDDILRNMSGGQFIGLVAVAGGLLVGLVAALAGIVTPFWRRVRQHDAETQLKRDLVAAGFTADEIERVVQATAGPPARASVRR